MTGRTQHELIHHFQGSHSPCCLLTLKAGRHTHKTVSPRRAFSSAVQPGSISRERSWCCGEPTVQATCLRCSVPGQPGKTLPRQGPRPFLAPRAWARPTGRVLLSSLTQIAPESPLSGHTASYRRHCITAATPFSSSLACTPFHMVIALRRSPRSLPASGWSAQPSHRWKLTASGEAGNSSPCLSSRNTGFPISPLITTLGPPPLSPRVLGQPLTKLPAWSLSSCSQHLHAFQEVNGICSFPPELMLTFQASYQTVKTLTKNVREESHCLPISPRMVLLPSY